MSPLGKKYGTVVAVSRSEWDAFLADQSPSNGVGTVIVKWRYPRNSVIIVAMSLGFRFANAAASWRGLPGSV